MSGSSDPSNSIEPRPVASSFSVRDCGYTTVVPSTPRKKLGENVTKFAGNPLASVIGPTLTITVVRLPGKVMRSPNYDVYGYIVFDDAVYCVVLSVAIIIHHLQRGSAMHAMPTAESTVTIRHPSRPTIAVCLIVTPAFIAISGIVERGKRDVP